MTARFSLRVGAAALFLLSRATLSFPAPLETMQIVRASTDLLAAVQCRRAGFPYMLRLDADHVVCLLSAAGAEQNIERVQDVLNATVRAVRGLP